MLIAYYFDLVSLRLPAEGISQGCNLQQYCSEDLESIVYKIFYFILLDTEN